MPEFDATIRYADIQGFPGYKVGTDGSVWSCFRRGNRGIGMGSGGARIADPSQWNQLKPNPRPNGYLAVSLYDSNRKFHFMAIHSLVLESFIGRCPTGYHCRHFPDSSKKNNALDNLSWGTVSQNMQDKHVHGTMPIGATHHSVKLTQADCDEILALSQSGMGVPEISALKKCGKTTTRRIIDGEHWSRRKQSQ